MFFRCLTVKTVILPQATVRLAVHRLGGLVSPLVIPQVGDVEQEVFLHSDKEILNSSSIVFEKDAVH